MFLPVQFWVNHIHSIYPVFEVSPTGKYPRLGLANDQSQLIVLLPDISQLLAQASEKCIILYNQIRSKFTIHANYLTDHEWSHKVIYIDK